MRREDNDGHRDRVGGKLKHKVLREPVSVALNGKMQGFGGNAIEFGEVCIEHDLLAADAA